jgi:uncharacterized protein (TIRG00374 family)
MKENIKLIIGIAIGAILLFLFFRKADFSQFLESLKEANYGIIFIIFVLLTFTYVLRGLRWQYFLLPIKKAKLSNLITTTIIGFTVTTLLPGRLGEIARPYLLGVKENISKSAAFATVIVERLFDFITIFLFFSFYLLLKPPSAPKSVHEKSLLEAYQEGGIIGIAICVFFIILLILIHLKTEWFQSLMDKLIKPLPKKFAQKVRKPLNSFIKGLVIIDMKKNLPFLVIYSLVLWLIIAFCYWLGLIAFNIKLPFYFAFFLNTAAAIGAVIPTPAGVGAYHMACQICLVVFLGLDANISRAYATIMHAVSFFPIAIFGIILIWMEGLSFSKIKRMRDEPANNKKINDV